MKFLILKRYSRFKQKLKILCTIIFVIENLRHNLFNFNNCSYQIHLMIEKVIENLRRSSH